MRKLFTTLKSVVAVAIVASMTLASSCSYDDTAIKNRVDKVEKDLAALTERVTALENQLKSDVAALTELINNKAVVTNLTTDAKGVTTVELSNGKSFKVYPECTVVDTDTDTNTYIGVKADENGVLYFAVFEMGEFKEWLTIEGEKVAVYDGNDQCECIPVTDTNDDTYVAPYLNEEDGEYYYAVLDRKDDNKFVEWYLVNGEKVAVYDGNDDTLCECEPVDIKFQVNTESGMLEFSVDGGFTWNPTGLSAADAGQQIIAGVTDNGNNTVTFTLADNSSFSVIKADLIEFDATRGQLYVLPGETKEINFTINTAVADVNVMNQPLGWSAEVVLAPADEEGDDEVDPGMGILAAGGTELVLKITGPAQEFVDAGFAAKEGDIVVHFNGNNGTCQVGKIAVNLAEIKLAVDAEGNVTLENTVAYEQTNYFGETFTDFADFYIGIVPVKDYEQYGDKVFADNWDDWAWEYTANVNHTKRTTGFSNVFELVAYEEGVTEKEVYNFTVDQLAGAFWPTYNFEIGEEYIIFVSLNGEMVNYQEHPVLKNAVMATYKKIVVEAEYVADSATWNDASFVVSLAGYTHYVLGWMPTAELEQLVQQGAADTVENAIPMVVEAYGVTSAGPIIEGSYVNETITLAWAAENSLTGWAPALNPGTEYYFFIYPLNIASEMDLYNHQAIKENVKVIGSFTTKPLVEGNFDAGIEYEVAEMTANGLTVYAYFGEDIVGYWYAFSDIGAFDTTARAAEIMEQGMMYDFEYSDYLYAYQYQPTYPTYLQIVAVNANGEYVFVEQSFEPEPLPEGVINSFEFLGQYYDLDDNPDSSGGGYIYQVKCADGNEYKIEVYWKYCNADGTINEGTYNYCYNAFDVMYSGWDGFCIESSETYYGSRLIVEADKITLEIANVAAYVYTENGTEEPGDNTGGEVEDGVTYVNTFVEKAAADGYCDYFHFSDGTGNNEVKFVVDRASAVVNDWIKTGEFTTFQSSVSYVYNGSQFSFMNTSLIVNGTTYANSDVSSASASVDADGNVTINFTVGGTAYVFKHNKQ
ncbi:MAG: hypothetical protein IJB03_00380 [Alistipes sp.]|nr:hypothetical protein [Alistipes sp.]